MRRIGLMNNKRKLEKRRRHVHKGLGLLILAILISTFILSSGISVADGAYEQMKLFMQLKIVNDVSVPDFINATKAVPETEGESVCIIHMPNKYIGISGRDKNDRYESLLFNNLTQKQVLLYAITLCTMYESIDQSRTTADSVLMGVYYSDEEDPIIILNAEVAKKVSDTLSEIASSL